MGNDEHPKIVDLEGFERDWGWLEVGFGAIELERVEVPAGQSQVYRLVKLEVAEGPAVQVVNVLGLDGLPLEGIRVVRSWPEGPEFEAGAETAAEGRNTGVSGPTGTEGNLGFGLGTSDRYEPPAAGTGVVWVADEAGPSDVISGLGLLDETDHQHLNLTFQLVDLSPAVPEPKGLPGRRLFEQVADSAPPAAPKPASTVVPTGQAAAPQPAAATPAGPSVSPPSAPRSPQEGAWAVILEKLDLIAELLEKRLSES